MLCFQLLLTLYKLLDRLDWTYILMICIINKSHVTKYTNIGHHMITPIAYICRYVYSMYITILYNLGWVFYIGVFPQIQLSLSSFFLSTCPPYGGTNVTKTTCRARSGNSLSG